MMHSLPGIEPTSSPLVENINSPVVVELTDALVTRRASEYVIVDSLVIFWVVVSSRAAVVGVTVVIIAVVVVLVGVAVEVGVVVVVDVVVVMITAIENVQNLQMTKQRSTYSKQFF